MNLLSKVALVALAAAGVAGSAPAFAADRSSDGYHWEFTPGPRGTARRVADRAPAPMTLANDAGHWRQPVGPRGTAMWVPADHARRAMPVEQMAGDKNQPNAG